MKGERIAQLELLLHSHPEGLRRAEIARRLGVHRSTITRYVNELKQYAEINEENNLIKINVKDSNEEPIALSIYESLAFNLGAKMFATNTDIQNPHLVSGLRKIARNMENYAPQVSENIRLLAEDIDKQLSVQKGGKKYNFILEALIDSWVSGRISRIHHINEQGIIEETEFAPYFIGYVEEENGRNPISVTGRLRHSTQITTLSIEKIKEIQILEETYTIPDNLKAFKKPEIEDGYKSPDMVPLVLEMDEKSALNSFSTLVHNPAVMEKREDGKYICHMKVENSIELILRIVQGGDAVRILEPENFKKKFCSFLSKILEKYK